MFHVLLSQTKLCLISCQVPASYKWLQNKSGSHQTANCVCQPKVVARIEKILPAKFSRHPKLTANKEGMPAKKRQDQHGCYPKLADRKVYTSQKAAASQKQLPTKCRCKAKGAASQKKRLQSNLAASQKQLPANCQ